MSIKEHISGTSIFSHFREGYLWYKTDTGLEFPVPPEDTKGADFFAEMRSVTMMRWIRKHLEHLKQARTGITGEPH